MGPSPLDYVRGTAPESMAADFAGFVHRFARQTHLTALLTGVQGVLARDKSLEACFLEEYRPRRQDTILPPLDHLVRCITDAGRFDPGHLLALPQRGSACKRLHLFFAVDGALRCRGSRRLGGGFAEQARRSPGRAHAPDLSENGADPPQRGRPGPRRWR